VAIDDGRDRTVTIVNDLNGQAIRRDEADQTSAGDPHEIWYRFGGRQLGYTGNNGTLETDYQTTAESRTATQGTGAFRNGATLGASYGDFALGYAPVTSFSDAGGGSHVVQAGETLSSIAANLWGDASLWYKLAEANGMTTANALMEGQSLIVPAGVNRNRYDASTFRPYDPSDAIGDASPTNPKMPKKNKCGTVGIVLMVSIAVAVTALSQGALTGALASAFGGGAGATIGGAALAGMAGSAVSQGVGAALGIQKFDWKAVAMAGITAGAAAGLDKLGAFARLGISGSSFGAQAAQGALASGVAQGIGVATGLQSKFDFAGVAAAGLGQGVSTRIGGRDFNARAMRIGADALASAASRSVLTGTSFGDNLVVVLPSVIGRTIGGAIESALSGRSRPVARAGVEVTVVDEDPAPPPTEIPPAYQELVRDLGGSLVRQPNGLLTLEGISPEDLIAAAARRSDVRAGTDGLIRPTLLNSHYMDTAPDPEWQPKMKDFGGNTFLFDPGATAIRSNYLETRNYGAIRFFSNGGRTFVYEGGSEYYPELGVLVSQGPMMSPQAIADQAPPPAERPLEALSLDHFRGQLFVPTNRTWDFSSSLRPAYATSGPTLRQEIRSTAFDVLPVVGALKAAVQMFTGRDLVTNQGVNRWEEGVGIIAGLFPGGRDIAKGEDIARLARRAIENIDPRVLIRGHPIGGRRSTNVVDNFARRMEEDGYAFPPIDVIEHNGRLIVADGHHRRAAALRTNTPVNVRILEREDFPNDFTGWSSYDDIIFSSSMTGPDRLTDRFHRRR
jgi:hypothetical protein